jgi:Dyp-type peroxidase family
VNKNPTTQATSRSLKQATELTLMAPIKSGFVAVPDVMSYATRLHIVLRTLFELRRIAVERDELESAGAIEKLRSLFDVRWALINDDTALLMAVTFDRSWESYIQGIVDDAGPLLDLIFAHCEDYAQHRCRDGFAAFASWVRAHQIQCDFFYAASPAISVDDGRWLLQLAAKPEAAAEVVVGAPIEQANADAGYRVLTALCDLTKWFPGKASDPGSDRAIWNDAARATIPKLSQLTAAGLATSRQSDWLAELQASGPSAVPAPALAQAEVQALRANVQGNVLTRRENLTHGLVALVQCERAGALQALLAKVAGELSSDIPSESSAVVLNVAFTFAGLQRVSGLSQAQLLELPKEFRDGMEARAGLLGDTGPVNSPDYWQRPIRNWPNDPRAGQLASLACVDVVLILQGAPAPVAGDHQFSTTHPLYAALAALIPTEASVVHVQPLRRYPEPDGGNREHFGFRDLTSQPVPDLPEFNASVAARDRIPLGEILLGHPNARQRTARWPSAGRDEHFKDGTFMVMRKLEQDVAGFQDFSRGNAAKLGIGEASVKAAILGRDQESGRSLVAPGLGSNDFDYSSDPSGKVCPLHSHIRRSNPRHADPAARALTPRILRRGFSYGDRFNPDRAGGRERGVLFMAYNASIAQQFEVVQRWLNGGNSAGGFSGQADLFSGTLPPKAFPHYIDAPRGPKILEPPRDPLVKLRWGLYLFVPSRAVLEAWAARSSQLQADPAPAPDSAQLAWGRELLRGLPRLAEAGPIDGIDAWKRVLEDVGMAEQRAALWTAIRAEEGGVIETPYGILVGSAAAAAEVLSDHGETYSVAEYGERMQESIGLQYLGIDKSSAAYEKASSSPNQFVRQYSEQDAFVETLLVARECLARRDEVDVGDLAAGVITQLCDHWFGLPQEDHVFEKFLVTSKHTFQPHPSQALADAAKQVGPELVASYEKLAGNKAGGSKLLSQLLANDPSAPVSQLATAMMSLASGFLAATYGSFLAAIDPWIESGALWRMAGASSQQVPDELRPALLRALQNKQGPTVIYRRCQLPTTLHGVSIAKGALVVIGLGSAANDLGQDDDPEQWLFGGTRDVQAHACPARPMATGVMLGLVAALLELKNPRRTRRLVLAYER